MILALMISCKKEKLEQITGSNSNAISKSIKVSNSPKNIDNVLYFDSEEHLKNYYKSLDEIIEKGYNDSLDIDSLLQETEEALNFLSFRQDFINKYDWEGKEFTAEEKDNMYQKDFIIDQVRKSILNENLEVGIGQYIYVYYSENQVYKIPNSELAIIAEFRKLEKGSDYAIPFNILKPSIELISNTASYGYSEKAEELDQYRSAISHNIYSCDIYRKNIDVGFYRYYDTTYYLSGGGESIQSREDPYTAIQIEVDFGDNTPTHIENNIQEFNIDHTYSSIGTYIVTVTYTYINVYSGNTETVSGTREIVVNGACTDQNVHSYGSQSDGSWELAYKVWVKQDVFGKHLASYSHSWKKNSRGKWKRQNANLFCRVEGVFRDENCSADEFLAKSKTTYGKRLTSKKHRNKKYRDVQNGDCHSSHSFGGGSWFNELVLNPC
jgi:hypothetical protein